MAPMGQTILTPFQQSLLDSLSHYPYITKHFFLTGGTALSEFYFHHRFSEDFDLFAVDTFDPKAIMTWLKFAKKATGYTKVEQQAQDNQITLFLYKTTAEQPVKIDFAYFPFEHLGIFKKLGGLNISSVEDVTVNKLQAISTRARSRDYYDLMLCLEHLKWDSKTLVKNYRLKYDVFLPPESLTTAYTSVQQATDLPIFLGKVDWTTVIDYFLSLARKEKSLILK